MMMALPHNATGLLTVRFFLGVCEAPLGPGLTIIVAMWYRRSEQPLRHAAWFAGNSVAGIFGGIVAYGIGHIHSVAPWKVKENCTFGLLVRWIGQANVDVHRKYRHCFSFLELRRSCSRPSSWPCCPTSRPRPGAYPKRNETWLWRALAKT